MADEITAITEVTRDLAYRQLDAQLQASGSYDAKTIGVIAFDVAGLQQCSPLRTLLVGFGGL